MLSTPELCTLAIGLLGHELRRGSRGDAAADRGRARGARPSAAAPDRRRDLAAARDRRAASPPCAPQSRGSLHLALAGIGSEALSTRARPFGDDADARRARGGHPRRRSCATTSPRSSITRALAGPAPRVRRRGARGARARRLGQSAPPPPRRAVDPAACGAGSSPAGAARCPIRRHQSCLRRPRRSQRRSPFRWRPPSRPQSYGSQSAQQFVAPSFCFLGSVGLASASAPTSPSARARTSSTTGARSSTTCTCSTTRCPSSRWTRSISRPSCSGGGSRRPS